MSRIRYRAMLGAAFATGAAFLLGSCASSTGEPLVQGWSQADREGWYWASQGSRLMPYAWFNALEQPGTTAPFADPAYLASFGYIPGPGGRENSLPIGFAIDRQPDEGLPRTGLRWYAGQPGNSKSTVEPWLGFNCSACHTAQLSYQGQPIRIDGGPGLGDFDALIKAADTALIETRDDPAKWARFVAKVLPGQKDTPANREMLRRSLSDLIAWQKSAADLNEPPLPDGQKPIRAGFARVDAFGHIYNKIVLFTGADDPIVNPADAPVSYPFLWDIHRQKKVQWNGAAQNQRLKLGGGRYLDYGAMGRNAGEVIGVFGEVVTVPSSTPGQPKDGYRSTVYADNLDRLEKMLARLKAPKWPSAFPAIDTARAAEGAKLFAQRCASCHMPAEAQPKDGPIEVMVPFSSTGRNNLTDIWMACNAFTYDGRAGRLKGTKDGFISGEPLPAVAPVGTMLATTVKGTLLGKKVQILKAGLASLFGIERPPVSFQSDEVPLTPEQVRDARRQFCTTTINPALAYKARPLDGIWATAPYLHNGSVPTLYDLMLPAAQRPKSFLLGTRDYDPVKAGYVTGAQASGNIFVFETQRGGRPVDGNSNAGHDYGASSMTDEQRWQLVEYMKTL